MESSKAPLKKIDPTVDDAEGHELRGHGAADPISGNDTEGHVTRGKGFTPVGSEDDDVEGHINFRQDGPPPNSVRPSGTDGDSAG